MDSTMLGSLVVWYAVFLFSTTLHEACHSYAAAWGEDDTAYRAGSATLNPIPHMQREKVGMIIAPLVTFFLNGGNWMIGWASAPFNPFWAARYPRRSFVMSLAGPLSHLVPAGIAFIGMYIGLRNGFFSLPGLYDSMYPVSVGENASGLAYPLAMLCNITLQLNILLFVFNLMPLPPLDGSEIWYMFIKKEETRLRWRYMANSYAFAGLLLAWYYFPTVFSPLWRGLLRFLYSSVLG